MKSAVLCLLIAQSAVAATFTVSMVNTRFNPSDLTINVGDTVTWRCDVGFHDTVSGREGSPDGVWNSSSQFPPIMRPGQSFSFRFNTAGTYPYYCTPHWAPPLNMVGTIRVIAPNSPPTVSMISPPNGANLSAPADIIVEAGASDSDGTVQQVELSMNGSSLGVFSSPPYRTTVTGLGPGNYTFSAIATDNANATDNASASVTVSGQQPTITNPPQSQTVNIGSDVTFAVEATGSAPLGYQWFFGPSVIAGANSPSLLLTNVSSADSGIYTVQVSNEFGSASASATLTVTNPPTGTPPSITTQPQSETLDAGTNLTFTVAAIGSPPLQWQWFFNGAPIADATNSFLDLVGIGLANAGDYFATVTNAFGSAVSSIAMLTVIVPPVCDFILSKTGASFGPEGGADSVNVLTPPNCAWTVANTNSWITITSGSGGVGPATVSFTVSSNSTRTARTGVLLIAGNSFTVTQAAALFPAKNDFNHDGQTDFLWQQSDRRVRLWLMNGTDRVGTMLLRNGRPAAVGSRIVGTHDFDSDRNVDILWQRNDGWLQIWLMNGTNYLRAEMLSGAPGLGTAWQVVGLGDFDRDLNQDILLRHRNGYLLVWYMRGKQFLRQRFLYRGDAIPLTWRVAGVADINSDSYADILWQRSDSAIVVWFMTGETPTGGPLLSHLPRINARIVGLNDLNQDDGLDFIWRHTDGRFTVWWMNQTNRIGSFPVNHGEIAPPGLKFAAPGN